ncbi:MAG: 3-deoxy-8-phosphooctulonate synthase [Saprospirales bacterium]|nr:3-deoxy-8-phosphooctulonate synthase [Saprospirales bacterium]
MQKTTILKSLGVTNPDSFLLIAGPCVVESRDMTLRIAEQLAQASSKLQLPLVFKASYRKANRSSLDSFTGIGDDKALQILEEVKLQFGLPLTTDIHKDEEAAKAAEVVDVLQIPAFLCRQTSLLLAAAMTGKTVNIKKGQFAGPEAMKHAVEKIRKSGNDKVMLTERGTTFGYHDLVVDFRSIPTMQELDVPVIMDCTHALQQPNQAKGVTGGQPRFIDTIASAAIAAGADGIFLETHPDPANALSDGANMLPLDQLAPLLKKLIRIRAAIVG